MQQMNPFVGIRLGQAKELAVQRLGGRLFQIDQNKEQLVFDRRERAIAIGGVGAANALQALQGLLLEDGLKAGLKHGHQVLEFAARESG